jgi:PmbA protein
MEKYTSIVKEVLDIAKSKGVQADCILDTNSVLSLKSEEQQLAEHKVSTSLVLGVRVIKDNKTGTSYSESWDKESLNHMVNEAIEFSKYTKEEPLEEIELSRNEYLDGTIDKIYQDDNTPLQDKINFALSLESEVKKLDKTIKSTPYNNFSQNEGQRIYGNHLGTFCGQKSRTFSCYTSALIEREGMQSMHYHASIGRKFSDLNLKDVVDVSYFHADKLLGAKPIETGDYDIIFTTDELSDLFACFSGLFSAKAAMNNLNPWKDKVGEQLADSNFSMIDRPTLDRAYYYAPFDDEGYGTKDCSLFTNGKLTSFYHNSVTSKYFKTENTFHASRSPRGTLGVTGTNKVIQTSSSNENDVRKDRYFEVVKMQGLHSGADPISGNFSFGASGYLKEGDQIIEAVSGITISGNFFKLLKEIKDIGNIMHGTTSLDFFAPTIRFGGLRVAGS